MSPEQRRLWVRLVLRFPRADLSAAQKTVLIALETYADYRDGANAHPGEENLAVDTGITARAVRDAIKRGRDLGLIEQTHRENPKAGLAAVYRLTLPTDYTVSTGTAVPVDNSTTGTAVPVETATTGTAVHHHRNGHVISTGTAVPPTLHAPSKYQVVVSDWGTSPEQPIATHTDRVPSRFCDLHPQGTRQPCGDCANARTAFHAWQADRAAIDVAIATAEDRDRKTRRWLIEACHAAGGPCDDFGRLDDLSPCDHPNVPRRIEDAS